MVRAKSITSPVLVLVGPTAIGKTDLSLRIAAAFGCEIISMDSMQVYRYMDIGTAKASREERRQVVHHLIDIRNPDEQYDAACFVNDALAAIDLIVSHGKLPLITGGTGLYLSALINGLFDEVNVKDEIRVKLRERLNSEGREALHQELLQVDPKSGERIHKNDTHRLLRCLEIYHATGVPWSEHLHQQAQSQKAPVLTRVLHLGLTCDRELLYERIKIRSNGMMQSEFKAEVESLLAMGYSSALPSMQAIGYRHMSACITGEWDLKIATATLTQDTRRYAKRQMTWFKRNQETRWHDIRHSDQVLNEIDAFLRITPSDGQTRCLP
jgi:tRNA dimethylallyltransferase